VLRLQDSQVSNDTIKTELRALHIVGAREIPLEDGSSAILVLVPFPQLSEYRKIQKILVDELEKKFSKHVVVVAQRTMLSPHCNRSNKHFGPRPRSRTLKNVQEAVLDDIVFPAEITGKRIRFKLDGSRVMTARLTPSEAPTLEGKLDTFAGVYKTLTSKDVRFEFDVAHE
jgi:small subunit ribosomal protein S7e